MERVWGRKTTKNHECSKRTQPAENKGVEKDHQTVR